MRPESRERDSTRVQLTGTCLNGSRTPSWLPATSAFRGRARQSLAAFLRHPDVRAGALKLRAEAVMRTL